MANPETALGKTVKRLRREAALSQELVAWAAGISAAQLAQIEGGNLDQVRFSTFVRLALALGIEPRVLAQEAGL